MRTNVLIKTMKCLSEAMGTSDNPLGQALAHLRNLMKFFIGPNKMQF